MIFKEGDRAFIIENNMRVTPIRIIRRDGEFYTIQFANLGWINLRGSRLYHTEEEALRKIGRTPPSSPNKEEVKKGHASPYGFDNSRSPYGI